MNAFALFSWLFTIAVLISYLNYRFIKMDGTIALTMAALMLSIVFIIAAHLGLSDVENHIVANLNTINFHSVLMNGMLSFLLFAGALNIDISRLNDEKWEIGLLAFFGTIASCFIVGTLIYFLLQWLNHPLGYVYCLLFGALISPTDPIAVLAIFRKVGAPDSLDARLSGESLFNDGVAVVLFITIYTVIYNGGNVTAGHVFEIFFQQAIGGVIYGILLGFIGYWLIKPIDNYQLEIFITLAIVTGGYTFAQWIDISGPLAMVVAGIFIGNHSRAFHMSNKTRENLDNFWEVVDSALNAILFLLIGLELNLIKVTHFELVTGVFAIVIVLFSRTVSVGLPLSIMKLKRNYEPYSISIMVWGGLRGGLAIALALAVPIGPEREVILPMTYAVVLFSILAQGLSIGKLVRLCRQKLDS